MKNAFERTRTVVFIKPIYQDPHSVVPQLNATIMERSGEEGLRRVKGKPYPIFERRKIEEGLSGGHTFDTVTLGFELGEHNRHDCRKSERRSAPADD